MQLLFQTYANVHVLSWHTVRHAIGKRFGSQQGSSWSVGMKNRAHQIWCTDAINEAAAKSQVMLSRCPVHVCRILGKMVLCIWPISKEFLPGAWPVHPGELLSLVDCAAVLDICSIAKSHIRHATAACWNKQHDGVVGT